MNTRLEIASRILAGLAASPQARPEGVRSTEFALGLADELILIERDTANRPQAAQPAPGECIANWVADGAPPFYQRLLLLLPPNNVVPGRYEEDGVGGGRFFMRLNHISVHQRVHNVRAWCYQPQT